MRKLRTFLGIGLLVGLALSAQLRPKKAAVPFKAMSVPTEMFFTYLGDYPRDTQTDWSGSLQGVAHDDSHWYFTQGLDDGKGQGRGYLMKFPLTYDLRRGIPTGASGFGREVAGVRCVRGSDIPGNPLGSFWHFGDLVHHAGFLFVPVECSDNSVPQMIAVFRAGDLAYIGSQRLLRQNTRAGWCAVHPVDKCLYVPRGDRMTTDYGIFKYKLNLASIKRASESHSVTHDFLGDLAQTEHILILDECGRRINLGDYNQGGEFSGDGRLLFLCTGRAAGHVGGERAEGITVYETATWKRISHSRNGSMLFEYTFRPGAYREEPEGLTWWDLDKHPRRAEIPGGIRGQLHALLIDSLGNEYFFKHYEVDRLAEVSEELLPFAAGTAVIAASGPGRWKIIQGTTELGGFRSEAMASETLRVLRELRADTVGYLAGRGHPAWRYVLSGGRPPVGPIPGTTEATFDPLGLRLKRSSGGWVLTDESPHVRAGMDHETVLFFRDRGEYDQRGEAEREARTALKIIRKYGFTARVYAGSDANPAFVYFRR